MKTPKPRKPRPRLPSLSRERLEQLNTLMAVNPIIPAIAQDAVMQSLIAATNPQAESPDAVIASLDKADQQAVRSAMPFYARTMGAMNTRGRAALMRMSDEEFRAALGQTDEDTDEA